MKRQTYKLICELCQLTLTFLAVVILSLVFYALSKWLKPKPLPQAEHMQIDDMQSYHRNEGRTNLTFFE